MDGLRAKALQFATTCRNLTLTCGMLTSCRAAGETKIKQVIDFEKMQTVSQSIDIHNSF